MLSDILGTLSDSDDDAPPTRAKPRRVTGSADKKRKLGELSGAVSEDLTHCPVCMDWHRGDIFQCPEGHLLCGPCKAGLQNDACPSCRSPLGSIRARAVEKMLQAVMMPCRWHENGCTWYERCTDETRSSLQVQAIHVPSEGLHPHLWRRRNGRSHRRCAFRGPKSGW